MLGLDSDISEVDETMAARARPRHPARPPAPRHSRLLVETDDEEFSVPSTRDAFSGSEWVHRPRSRLVVMLRASMGRR